jgi:hypothetical protein
MWTPFMSQSLCTTASCSSPVMRTLAEKRRAERAVWHVQGVRGLTNTNAAWLKRRLVGCRRD